MKGQCSLLACVRRIPHVCYEDCLLVHGPLHVVLAVRNPSEESVQNNWDASYYQ